MSSTIEILKWANELSLCHFLGVLFPLMPPIRTKTALIKLPQPIRLSQTIQPTKLPRTCGDIGEHEAATALGVGIAREYQYIYEVDGMLREASLSTVACDSILEFKALGVGDHRSHICASTSKDGSKTAGGDSGSASLDENNF